MLPLLAVIGSVRCTRCQSTVLSQPCTNNVLAVKLPVLRKEGRGKVAQQGVGVVAAPGECQATQPLIKRAAVCIKVIEKNS